MKLTILQQADEELHKAASYYESKQKGLGLKFLDEIESHVQWILKHPETPRIRKGNYRRVNLKVFPFYIPYMHFQNDIWILAIAHSYKKPYYWLERKDQL